MLIGAAVTWDPVFGGEFYRVTTEYESDGGSFEGRRRYGRRLWIGTNGDLHPLSVKADGQAVTSMWGRPGAQMGRTEYRMQEDGTLCVRDWVLTEDGWRQFNEAVYTRGDG